MCKYQIKLILILSWIPYIFLFSCWNSLPLLFSKPIQMLEEITVGNTEFSLWVCLWGPGSGIWTNGEQKGSVGLFLVKTLEKGVSTD